jgi:hypothetical protein
MAKLNAPEAVDFDGLAGGIAERAKESSGATIKGFNAAAARYCW